MFLCLFLERGNDFFLFIFSKRLALHCWIVGGEPPHMESHMDTVVTQNLLQMCCFFLFPLSRTMVRCFVCKTFHQILLVNVNNEHTNSVILNS